MDLNELTQDAFTALLGATCAIRDDDIGEIRLTVAEVQALPSRPTDEAFSVLFEGPGEPRLDQRMYSMQIGDLGTHNLFLVPVGASPEIREYEAIFTRVGKS